MTVLNEKDILCENGKCLESQLEAKIGDTEVYDSENLEEVEMMLETVQLQEEVSESQPLTTQ